jgi:hypothetical protein
VRQSRQPASVCKLRRARLSHPHHLNPAKVGNVADRATLRLLWNELEADLLAKIANLAQALE